MELYKGKVFDSFQALEKAIESYSFQQNVIYKKANTCTIKHTNSKIVRKEKFYPESWKYKSLQYKCKHFGTYSSISKGIRPNQDTSKTGCSSFLRVSASKERGGLQIVSLNLEHTNHPQTSKQDALRYPEKRRLNEDQKKEMSSLLNLKWKPAKICKYFFHNHGLVVTTRDVHNHRHRERSLTNGKYEESLLNAGYLGHVSEQKMQCITNLVNKHTVSTKAGLSRPLESEKIDINCEKQTSETYDQEGIKCENQSIEAFDQEGIEGEHQTSEDNKQDIQYQTSEDNNQDIRYEKLKCSINHSQTSPSCGVPFIKQEPSYTDLLVQTLVSDPNSWSPISVKLNEEGEPQIITEGSTKSETKIQELFLNTARSSNVIQTKGQKHPSKYMEDITHFCNICNKVFNFKSNLKRHKAVHMPEKKLVCYICNIFFSQTHLAVHKREKRHVCDICKKGFSCANYLKRHQVVHKRERPFKCTYCSNTFKQSYHLQRHLRIHKRKKNIKKISGQRNYNELIALYSAKQKLK